VPLRVFRGWSPTRTTTHFDADGNMTGRSEHWIEPQWDEQSRAEMLALAVLEAQECPLCGGPRSECQAPDADDAYIAESVRCAKATAVAIAQEQAQDAPQPQARLWATTRRG